MARIFFQKDGPPSDHRTSQGQHVPIETVVEKLTPFEKRYFMNPPDLEPAKGPASPKDDYRHVVVRIDENEINAVFPKEGYYHVEAFTPEDARRLFGM